VTQLNKLCLFGHQPDISSYLKMVDTECIA